MPVCDAVRLAEASFRHAFLPEAKKAAYIARQRTAATAAGLA
jgi:hypothetical protein